MKIKIFTLTLMAFFALGAMAQDRPTAEINKASTPPVIDGVVDDVWAESPKFNIDKNFQSEVPTVGASGETTWQMLWHDDPEGLYLLVIVNDDQFYPNYAVDPPGNSWEYDKPEIYFDVNFDLQDGGGAGGGAGHHQIADAFTEENISGGAFESEDAGVVMAYMVNDPDYLAEYFFPKSYLVDRDGSEVDFTGDIGFDVTVIDRDPGDDARKRAVWANTGVGGAGTESWNNMDDCGIIQLKGAQPPIYVDDISLPQDLVINENNGTLQIEATITPANANEGKLGWSVADGTGRAKIDENGVVTGVLDGTVTVTAKSRYAEATTTVTISNQIVTLPELNLVRNGFFDEVDEEGSPLEWSAGTVFDGEVYLDPPAGGANYWDFTMVQQGFGCDTESEYTFTFTLWAEDSDTVNVDFEDPSNDYNRYGSSNHPLSNGGESDWTFVSNTERTKYTFDVVFNEKVETTTESLQFMVGLHDPGIYIDSVMLYKNSELALLTEGVIEVTSVTVSSEGDASTVEEGGTLQMSAEVLPADATLTGVRWSVMGMDGGWASIDENGLLTGDSAGMVTVYAHAKDDSGVMGMKEIEVTWPASVEEHAVNTLKLYPNPAVNELTVELPELNSTVSVYNSAGMLMDEVNVSGTELRLDISDYASGVYIVKSGERIAKFIK